MDDAPCAAAVLIPCSNRKSVRPDAKATAVALPRDIQVEVETAWRIRLAELPLACVAGALYAGRGIQLGRRAAEVTGGKLFIVSAGLGLVAADRKIPAYGLTVSGHGPESIAPKIAGRFDVEEWWRSVSGSKFSTDLAAIFQRADGAVLVALTQPYARLLSASFEALTCAEVARLRIVGIGLAEIFSARVSRQVLPYDGRLDSILPGTKTDFPQRALLHFVENGLSTCPGGDVNEHRAWVEKALNGRVAPARPVRLRLTDEEIVILIQRHLPEIQAVGRLLRVIRDREGVACEQARFTRLYKRAIQWGTHDAP